MLRILLDAKDFRDLIGGRIVKKEGAEIALQDIGYVAMADALGEEMGNKNIS